MNDKNLRLIVSNEKELLSASQVLAWILLPKNKKALSRYSVRLASSIVLNLLMQQHKEKDWQHHMQTLQHGMKH